jgi:hypothetical protein
MAAEDDLRGTKDQLISQPELRPVAVPNKQTGEPHHYQQGQGASLSANAVL